MDILQQAVSLLIKGEVIVIPVEGTYCYVADPFNELAVNKLITLRDAQQVKDQPIMLVGDLEDLHRFVGGFSDIEEQTIMQNWPGDSTICFEHIQQGVNSKLHYNSNNDKEIKNTKKIALRIPSSDYILEVLHSVGQPLASIIVYNEQMPAKNRHDLAGIENHILKVPNSLSGKLSNVLL
jgi:tRNA A37 threonylcarbamoyladenosine synthetase subunit TsaC/SUA5/YrdC